jgi:N-acetylglucosaminyldiphosphoundecaprenol N-acetyl-beta-D-mannosaminyltransferase
MREIKLFGIKFLDGSLEEIIISTKKGGLIVVPSAPGLATIREDIVYYKALKNSSFAIFDSGYLRLLLLILKGIKVNKISGLKLLKGVLSEISFYKSGEIFLIDPSLCESNSNRELLKTYNHNLSKDSQYIAPIYKESFVEDKRLLNLLVKKKPKLIIINLGGGLQEKVGTYIYKNISHFNNQDAYQPTILCTGAAIAFLTGHQAKIPDLADRLHLGWALRCISSPKKFVPRYLRAFKLIFIVLKESI